MATPVQTKKRIPLSSPSSVYQDNFSPARGNALQAAVASTFGMSLCEVPNFIEMEEGYEAAIKRFYQQGSEKGECIKMKLDGIFKDNKWSYKTSEEKHLRLPEDNTEEFEKHVANVKQEMLEGPRSIPEEYNNKICIMRGKSPRGDFGHVVVAQHITNGTFEILHDPHPDKTFLDKAEAYGWCLFFV